MNAGIMTRRLAVAIPTYNSSLYIKEFFEQCLGLYIKYGIDIYIYDSSQSGETEALALQYNKKNEGLKYIRVPSETPSNQKVYQIFQDFSGSVQYEFLWICGDALRFSTHALHIINDYLDMNYDMLVVDIENGVTGKNLEFSDPKILFRQCGGYLTLYGAAILNIDRVLTGTDWEYYSCKYLKEDTINFSHFCFYFERICQIQKFKAACIKLQRIDGYSSPLKKFSLWKSETFRIWCHCWPEAVYALPNEYPDAEKADVVREKGIYSGILSIDNLLILRAHRIYNIKIFINYRKAWNRVTNVPMRKLFILSIVPSYILSGIQKKRHIRQRDVLKRFCDTRNRIFVYGTGIVASRCVDYLEEISIDYEAFIVTNITNESNLFLNHKIIVIDEYLSIRDEENDGIILAMNELNITNVGALLKEKGITDGLFTTYIEPL